MKLTVKLKMLTTEADFELLKSTQILYSQICNSISKTAFENKEFNNFKLHGLVYHDIRKQFPKASSQFVIRAIKTVADSYADKNKRASLHVFRKKSAVTFDSRILTFKIDSLGFPLVSIWTIEGKRRKIYLHLNQHQRDLFPKFRHETDLVLSNKNFYLNCPIEVETPEVTEPTRFIGVDLGVTNIAATSEGIIFSSEAIEKRRKQLLSLRGRLQRKATKSAKRHLKKLSKTESNFKKDTNHVISKNIVALDKDTLNGIALEKLTHIRLKTTVRKANRAQQSSWAFAQLQGFIVYKAQLAGVAVVFVNPKNTSRECSACGFVSKKNRKTQEHFECLNCGFKDHADINAAKVISSRALVNKPIVART